VHKIPHAFLITYSNNRTITEPSRLSDEPFVSADDNLSTNTSTPTSLKKQDSIESPSRDNFDYRKRNSKSLPLRTDGTLDFDGKALIVKFVMLISLINKIK
jgi:hypothetical protein